MVQDQHTGEGQVPRSVQRTMQYYIKYHHIRTTLGKGATEMRRHGREGTKLREGADLCTTNVRRRHIHQKIIYRVGGDKGRGEKVGKSKDLFRRTPQSAQVVREQHEGSSFEI